MKRHPGVVQGAKIINVLCAFLMSVAGLLLLTVSGLRGVTSQRILLGFLFGLLGAAKLFGYFSNDLYRLAFQFDLAIGILCLLLTLVISLVSKSAFDMLPMLLCVYVALDGLLKLQTSFDARRFGMKSWVLMLITAGLLLGTGGFTVVAAMTKLMRQTVILGIALMVDGLENIWVTAHTVRVRVKKKNISEQYGIEAE